VGSRSTAAAVAVAAAAAAVAIAMAVVGARTAGAQTPVPPEAVAAIARSMNCPLCQGYSLQDCPLEVCAQMRDLIRQKLEAGETRDEIVAAFVADYGPQVLNAPPQSGFFATAWWVPFIALAMGGAAVWAVWRGGAARRVRRTPEATTVEQNVDGVYAEVLERMAATEDDS
jgi:cytochrome c-type biogenesis protein CcmH